MSFSRRLAIMFAAVGMSATPAFANLEVCNNGTVDLSFAVVAQYGSPTFGRQQAYAYGWVTLKPGSCHVVVRSDEVKEAFLSVREVEGNRLYLTHYKIKEIADKPDMYASGAERVFCVRSDNFRRVAKSFGELEQCPDDFHKQLFNLYMGALANKRFTTTLGK